MKSPINNSPLACILHERSHRSSERCSEPEGETRFCPAPPSRSTPFRHVVSIFRPLTFTPVAHLIFSVSIPSSLLSPCFTPSVSAILTGRFHRLPVDPTTPALNPTSYWSHFNAAFLTPCTISHLH